MTAAEIALTAALGSSFLTGFASLGVMWFQDWRRGKADSATALHSAVMEVLSRSAAVALRGFAMGETMKVRSGLKEGFDIALRHRKPVDPLELHDWLAQDYVPLNAALSDVWIRCDQEGVRLANEVVAKCTDLLGVSVARQPVHSAQGRVALFLRGERWTDDMRTEHQRAAEALAEARKHMADYARRKLGQAPADLFVRDASLRESDDSGADRQTVSG